MTGKHLEEIWIIKDKNTKEILFVTSSEDLATKCVECYCNKGMECVYEPHTLYHKCSDKKPV
jgi:hypothetical protein